MKKSDLKTGMIVTTRKGNKYMVFLNAKMECGTHNVLVNLNERGGWMDLTDYNEDMKHKWCGGMKEFDIMQVEHLVAPASLAIAMRDLKNINLFLDYQREEKKRYTYAQIKAILGEEFEVVANAEDVKEMTLDDLKTGMIVTIREGIQYMVYKDIKTQFDCGDVIVNLDGSNSWKKLSGYNKNLTHVAYPEDDIIKVEETTHPYAFIRTDYQADKRKVLWERKKKYTYDQLKEKLGEEFEIVKE